MHLSSRSLLNCISGDISVPLPNVNVRIMNQIDVVIPNAIDLASLALRIFVGVLLIYLHGYSKAKNVKGTAKGLGSMKIPAPMLAATGATLLETIGALFLVVGFLTQITAGLLIINMLGATYIIGAKVKKMPELELMYLVGAVSLFLLGGGAFSVDALLKF